MYVTGFGKFGDVLDNPSTHVCNSCGDQAKELKIVQAKVLETSAVGAMEHLEPLYAAAAAAASPSMPCVIVHFGVNGKIDHFEIESTAYNCANFSIPDERGWQPLNETISADTAALDAPMSTDLDTARWVAKLQSLGLQVESSSDPGRYICNYVYYRSLRWCQEQPHCVRTS